MQTMYNNMVVLAVAMRKGGVGKTLFSVLLAQYFGAKKGNPPKRVLLMDMDTQQNASESLIEMDRDPHAKDVLLPPVHPDYDPNEDADWDGRSSTADLFYGGVGVVPYKTRFPFLDIVPASGEALQAVEMVRSEEVKEKIYDQLHQFFALKEVQELYDLIIIDTPPGMGAINRSVLRACTHILYPVVPEEKPIAGLRDMLHFAHKEQRYRETKIVTLGIVPNMVDRRYALHKDNLQALREDEVFKGLITPFEVCKRSAFPNLDQPNASPETIWQFSGKKDAKDDALKLCRFVEKNLYGKVSKEDPMDTIVGEAIHV